MYADDSEDEDEDEYYAPRRKKARTNRPAGPPRERPLPRERNLSVQIVEDGEEEDGADEYDPDDEVGDADYEEAARPRKTARRDKYSEEVSAADVPFDIYSMGRTRGRTRTEETSLPEEDFIASDEEEDEDKPPRERRPPRVRPPPVERRQRDEDDEVADLTEDLPFDVFAVRGKRQRKQVARFEPDKEEEEAQQRPLRPRATPDTLPYRHQPEPYHQGLDYQQQKQYHQPPYHHPQQPPYQHSQYELQQQQQQQQPLPPHNDQASSRNDLMFPEPAQPHEESDLFPEPAPAQSQPLYEPASATVVQDSDDGAYGGFEEDDDDDDDEDDEDDDHMEEDDSDED